MLRSRSLPSRRRGHAPFSRSPRHARRGRRGSRRAARRKAVAHVGRARRDDLDLRAFSVGIIDAAGEALSMTTGIRRLKTATIQSTAAAVSPVTSTLRSSRCESSGTLGVDPAPGDRYHRSWLMSTPSAFGATSSAARCPSPRARREGSSPLLRPRCPAPHGRVGFFSFAEPQHRRSDDAPGTTGSPAPLVPVHRVGATVGARPDGERPVRVAVGASCRRRRKNSPLSRGRAACP